MKTAPCSAFLTATRACSIGSTILAGFLLFAARAQADDYPFAESFRQTSAFDPDGTVSIQNTNGNITIKTWDRNEILIEGTKRAQTQEELEWVRLEFDVSTARAELTVRLLKRPGGGWFGGKSARGRAEVTVTLPATAALREIHTTNGNVHVHGVRGPIEVSLVNGSFEAQGLGGSTRVNSVNGQIRASFAAVPAGAKLGFETVNGSILVDLPSDVGLKVESATVNGNIDSGLPLTVRGRVDRRHLAGTIGDGRASADLRTVNGSIHLTNQ